MTIVFYVINVLKRRRVGGARRCITVSGKPSVRKEQLGWDLKGRAGVSQTKGDKRPLAEGTAWAKARCPERA